MTVFDMARKKAAASVRVVLRLCWVGVFVLVFLFFFSYFGTEDIVSSPVVASVEISGATSFSANLKNE